MNNFNKSETSESTAPVQSRLSSLAAAMPSSSPDFKSRLLAPRKTTLNTGLLDETAQTQSEREEGPSTLLALDHPVFETIPHTSSGDVMAKLVNCGAVVNQTPYPLYAAHIFGKPREFHWANEIKGYKMLYEDETHLKRMVTGIKTLQTKLQRLVDDNFPADDADLSQLSEAQKCALACKSDTAKISMIRSKPQGWFLDPIFAPDIIRGDPSASYLSTLDRVSAAYAKALKRGTATSKGTLNMLTVDDQTLRDMDSDPTDTLVGLPTGASGEATIPTRIAMCALAPPFKNSNPLDWLSTYAMRGRQLLLVPESVMLGSLIANRLSPIAKPMIDWTRDALGFSANKTVTGLGARVRNVFPVPFVINYALSPLYTQMSNARKLIPGLWHGVDDWDKMVSLIYANKDSIAVSADFSGMDTRISPRIVTKVGESLLKHGFSQFAAGLLSVIQSKMSVFTPSSTGKTRATTQISGVIPWLSGYKLTSELDTIYGLAATLDALNHCYPEYGFIDKWERGEFIIYALGDDTLFTLPKDVFLKLDKDKFTAYAKQSVGAVIEIDTAPVFLKRIILSKGKSPRMIARVIQQTFFNETRDDDRPAIVSLLGLKARLEGMDAHPWYPELRTDFEALVLDSVFAKELQLTSSDLVPNSPMSERLNGALRAYIATVDGKGWIDSLVEQAKYSHSALEALALIPADFISTNDDSAVRGLYRTAMDRNINAMELAFLQAMTKKIMA